MFSIFKKEVKSYFYSPIAYVLTGVFMIVSAFLFWVFNLYYQTADLQWMFNHWIFILVIIIFVSILTMRIFAEERKNGSDVLLMTSPVSVTNIVLGKFLATYVIFLAMVGLSLIFPVITFIFGNPAFFTLLGGYVGFILLGATFVAVGLFASSVTENQIISVVISFVTLLMMWIMGEASANIGGILSKIMNWISLTTRYKDFSSGILNLSSVVYYLSFTAVFLFVTVRMIEKRRWSQG